MSGVHYIDDVRVYVDEDGYVEYGVVINACGNARRVYIYKADRKRRWDGTYTEPCESGWYNVSGCVKLSTLRAGIKRGNYMFS